jgi:precorrin-6B methylase 2
VVPDSPVPREILNKVGACSASIAVDVHHRVSRRDVLQEC